MKNRNELSPNDPVPADLLSCADASVLCKWLCYFVQDAVEHMSSRFTTTSTSTTTKLSIHIIIVQCIQIIFMYILLPDGTD